MTCHLSVALRIYPSTVPLPQQSADLFPVHCMDKAGRKHARTSEGREEPRPLPPSVSAKQCQSSRPLLVRLRGIAQIGFHNLEALGEECLGFSIIHRRSDDAILAVLPIRRGRDLELRSQLKGVDDPQ